MYDYIDKNNTFCNPLSRNNGGKRREIWRYVSRLAHYYLERTAECERLAHGAATDESRQNFRKTADHKNRESMASIGYQKESITAELGSGRCGKAGRKWQMVNETAATFTRRSRALSTARTARH